MFLMHKPTRTLVEILMPEQLFNPCKEEVMGIRHAGEELQDPESFLKSEMMFLSGEQIPRCWLDLHYRETNSKELSLVGV